MRVLWWVAHTGYVTQPVVVKTVLILVDAQGQVTDDRALAVGGEVLETMSDGVTRSTLFTIDPSATEAR